MKFLLDQGLPRSTVQHLEESGIESHHVGSLGLSSATDLQILDEARVRNHIVVTLDSDFHVLLALSNSSTPSVIRIRAQGLKGDKVATIIQQVIATVASDLLAGSAVTVSERRLSLKRLPLLQSENQDSPDDSSGPN